MTKEDALWLTAALTFDTQTKREREKINKLVRFIYFDVDGGFPQEPPASHDEIRNAMTSFLREWADALDSIKEGEYDDVIARIQAEMMRDPDIHVVPNEYRPN